MQKKLWADLVFKLKVVSLRFYKWDWYLYDEVISATATIERNRGKIVRLMYAAATIEKNGNKFIRFIYRYLNNLPDVDIDDVRSGAFVPGKASDENEIQILFNRFDRAGGS